MYCLLVPAVKDSAEKDMFFKKLPAMIPAIPEPVAVRKVLPLLSRALEYGGAPASAVGSLMLIGRCGLESFDKCTGPYQAAAFCLTYAYTHVA